MADATKRRRWNVDVTQEDIDKAIQNDSYKCVVAQALAREIPDATRIEVDLQTIRFSYQGERLAYLTPYTVAGYIVGFDAGDEIHPFAFHLRDPQVKPARGSTAAGKHVKTKKRKIETIERRAANAQKVLDDDQSGLPERAKAEAILEETPAELEQAKAELDATRTEYKDAGVQLEHDKGRRQVRKVIKTKQRVYGSRVLRVNQEEGRVHYAG